MKKSFFARYGFVILLITAFMWPIVGAGARRGLLSNKNDVKEWLPDQYAETQEFRWFLKHFAGEEFVLLSWDGCRIDDPKTPDVDESAKLRQFVRALDPSAQPEPAADTFPVPTPESRLFKTVESGPGVVETIAAGLRKFDAAVGNVPKGLSREELQRLDEHYREMARDRLRGVLIGARGETCVVLTLSEVGKLNLRKTVDTIREVATAEFRTVEREQDGKTERYQVRGFAIPAETLHMGGPPVDNVAIDKAGESSLMRLAGFAGVIGLVISWWCLRSGRLIAMVFTAGIFSAALSLAIVWYVGNWAFGVNMNAILLTMPSLVYVAAISGAIHLSNYYRDTVIEEGSHEGAPGRSLKHAALPLGLATGTTAIGLLTLVTSELVPIQLFGIYSAAGVVGSLLLLCFFLPAAFEIWPLPIAEAVKHDPHHHVAHAEPTLGDQMVAFWRRVADFIIGQHGLVTVVGIGFLAVCGWGMYAHMTTTVELMKMFPKNSQLRNDYVWLEHNLGKLVPMEIVLKIDREKSQLTTTDCFNMVKAVKEQVEKLPEVGRSMSAVTFTPDFGWAQGQTGALGIAKRRLVNKSLDKQYENLCAAGFLSFETIAETVDGQIVPRNYELWRISARVAAQGVDYGQFVAHIKQQVESVIGDTDKQHTAGVNAIYTGLVPLVYKAQGSLLDGLLWGFVLDVILVTIVMTLFVREWSAGIVLLLPSIFPIITVFGLMSWLGIEIDTGTVMAPAVALGVTIDDVVHFMLMYRGGLKQGLSRGDSIRLAYKGCARAMWQSWGVIGLGLAVFAISPFTPTKRFGYMMVTLLTAALVGNLVILPAVLAGPFGAMFGRRFQKRRGPQPDAPAQGDGSAPGESLAEPATTFTVVGGEQIHPHLNDETVARRSIA